MSRNTWYLSLVILINRSGTMVLPFMTMYATQKLHFTIAQAGIIMALFGLGSIVGAFFGGKLTDRVGFYTIQLTALFGGGLMLILLGYLTNFYSLCAGAFMLSTINESFRPANSTAIAYYSIPENRVRSYSLNRLAINLGWAFGGALGGFLAGHNYHLLFWVDGITNISAGLLLIFILPVPTHLKASVAKNKQLITKQTSAYADKQYLFFILLTVFFAFCFFQMFTILPVYLKTVLGISEQLIGTLMAINGIVVAFVEMVLVYKLEMRNKPLLYIMLGTWMVGLSYGMYNIFTGHFWYALFCMMIITVGEMLAMPFMNSYWITRCSPHNQGQYAALYTMGWGVAQVAAPSLGGLIVDNFGYTTLWWIVFLVSVMAGLGYRRLK